MGKNRRRMNNDDDFAERLRNREIARMDQRQAHDEVVEHQEAVQQATREGARIAFEEMRSCTESLVQQVNAKLSEKFMSLAVPGGFGIMLGNRTASFTYAPPMFTNEGVPYVIVTFQSLASNFGFFQDAFDEEALSVEKWELEPAWDTDANSVVWRRGRLTHSSREIVQGAMEALQVAAR